MSDLKTKMDIAKSWLPRYTGMEVDEVGDYVLLTNFHGYMNAFSERFGAKIKGKSRPMQAATNKDGLTLINFGMGTANAATIMDLLSARNPKGVLFLGKCGGLKKSVDTGSFILPIAAIRGEGTSDIYLPKEVPALPSFKLHKFVSGKLLDRGLDYRTGVIYTTNRRIWEWDEDFKAYLRKLTVIGIDMETATVFITGHANQIARGALLLVSDMPMTPSGVKTEAGDVKLSAQYTNLHLDLGIEAMQEIGKKGEKIRHFK